MDKAIIEYSRLYTGSLVFRGYGGIYYADSEVSPLVYRRKLACLGFDKSAQYLINEACDVWGPNKNGESLFVCSDCNTPRDLYRNSGYKIVRDPEKADYVVVQEQKHWLRTFKYDVAFYEPDTKALHLLTVRHNSGIRQFDETVLDDDWEKITLYFAELGGDMLLQNDLVKGRACYIIPNYEVYSEILQKTYPNRKYCYEHSVSIDYPTEINMETLKVWEKYSDFNMLAKAIISSNWTEYPATLLVFINNEAKMVQYYGGQAMKDVLNQIGFDKYARTENILEGSVIEPKDWNLLQEWSLYKLGVPKTGGYANMDDGSEYKRFVREKRACAPLYISSGVEFSNLKAMMEK